MHRKEVLRRFERDGEEAVGAVLRDLVSSGLVFTTGQGDNAIYRATSEDDLQRLLDADSADSLKAMAWAFIYRNPSITATELARSFMFASEHCASLPKIVWNFDDTGFKSARQSARDHTRAFFWSVLLVDLGPVQFAGSLQAFSTADT